MAIVYWIHTSKHSNITKEGYIGVSVRPKRRLYEHTYDAVNNKHCNPKLQRAFKKYNENIKIKFLLEADENYCYMIEKKLRPTKKIGWNLAEGGFKPPSWKGRKHSEEHKRNARLAKKGKLLGPQSEESKHKKSISLKLAYAEGRKVSNLTGWPKGKPRSKETIEKLRLAGLGKKQSAESNAKRSATMKGRPGKKHSLETIEKIKKAKIGTVPWNKNLNKFTDERVAAYGLTRRSKGKNN